jgi:tetratricopeptide (TPR) repeat protein
MKTPGIILFTLLFSTASAVAQHEHSAPQQRAMLFQGLSDLHHPVSTKNPEAQQFFDQGLRFIFAFNHEEAVKSFSRAAELDPDLAMAHWGIALALGPNINMDVDPAREIAAYGAVQKALALSSKATEAERGYINALARRYSNDPKADLRKLAVDYNDAMGALMKRYPDDLDAATLCAESGMDLRPWKLWKPDGTPEAGTEEIVRVLESVLRRDPNHLGANHYYIHAVEASPNPERALPSAERLKTLAPAAGHLVHMPAHIMMRTGDYPAAAKANAIAADVDREYMRQTNNSAGMYALMYFNHNLHFLANAASMAGNYGETIAAANEFAANVAPALGDPQLGAFLDGYAPTPILMHARFGKWDEVLKAKQPASTLPLSTGYWHMTRGLAFAAKANRASAQKELEGLIAVEKTLPAAYPMGVTNSGADVLRVAEHLLRGRVAWAAGDKDGAIASFRTAVELEDKLGYDEPPVFFYPIRETLGSALLQSGKIEDAEQVFRADLERNPRNGRSLFGLLETLRRQGKSEAARFVQREFDSAWKTADVKLKLEEL